MIRCVNIDWLEVHALEPIEQPHGAEFFRSVGLEVQEREYGTRIYHEMFTILNEHAEPIIEVRRNPKSQGVYGIHSPNECHIRLRNSQCYRDDAVALMSQFLATYNYTFNRISRIDIALDFEKFDYGDIPEKFCQRYMKGVYSKIHQADIRAFGKDRWDGRTWNSLSWGKAVSQVTTKFYNKTLELTEAYDKPYIRYAWYRAGLIDDPIKCTKFTGTDKEYKPTIWRVEFSIKSSVKGWWDMYPDGDKKGHRSFRNTLDVYDSREKLWRVFSSLQEHYFHFRKYEKDKPKYRCARKLLWKTDSPDTFVHIDRVPSADNSHESALRKLAAKVRQYGESKFERDKKALAFQLAAVIDDDAVSTFGRDVLTAEEITALRIAISTPDKSVTQQSVLQRIINFKSDNNGIF